MRSSPLTETVAQPGSVSSPQCCWWRRNLLCCTATCWRRALYKRANGGEGLTSTELQLQTTDTLVRPATRCWQGRTESWKVGADKGPGGGCGGCRPAAPGLQGASSQQLDATATAPTGAATPERRAASPAMRKVLCSSGALHPHSSVRPAHRAHASQSARPSRLRARAQDHATPLAYSSSSRISAMLSPPAAAAVGFSSTLDSRRSMRTCAQRCPSTSGSAAWLLEQPEQACHDSFDLCRARRVRQAALTRRLPEHDAVQSVQQQA